MQYEPDVVWLYLHRILGETASPNMTPEDVPT